MKATGVVRRIDDLGRIVIPSTIRKKLGINQDTMLSFQLDDDSIVLKKIHSLEENNSEVLLKLLEKITENEILIVNSTIGIKERFAREGFDA